jgi:hypothetical protein
MCQSMARFICGPFPENCICRHDACEDFLYRWSEKAQKLRTVRAYKFFKNPLTVFLLVLA